MQPRGELYHYLEYHSFEEKLDNIISREEKR